MGISEALSAVIPGLKMSESEVGCVSEGASIALTGAD